MKAFRPLIILFKLAHESMQFAYQSIVANKLRTFLSLFGITIGIFAIISVFTMVDSLEKNVRDSLQALGKNVVYVQKWPWGGNQEYPWWKYFNRPEPTISDLDEIRRKSLLTESACFNVAFNKQVKWESNNIPETTIYGVSKDFDKIRSFEIENGRFFNLFEITSSRPIAVIGSEIAKELFQGANPIGKMIKIGGQKVSVIGVFAKEGKSAIGENSLDNMVLIPLNLARTMVDLRRSGPWIMVKAKENTNVADLKDELRGILRAHHKLKPLDDDDFALNQIDMLKSSLDSIFGSINFAGGFIAFFSIIVGGFGIANIMFVSVKERTSQIGVQKALGAKRYFILIQFLYEAVLLAVIGGAIGLILIFIGTQIVTHGLDFKVSLTISNVLRGLFISATIGVVSGFFPAWVASRLSPVEAINTKS
ncbi:ABC transporter permease [Tenuifilum thalassicum]|uniref:FtsX-like permease family protein n=1 Tax=Tenuifilum thalassicum TaxID=2590900 RepID=A0A7D4CQA4_9BACT|nr:ABC transporter permease [Tenuifilum thalassicum]QKG79285.1 FtsX-like permease family protein [Tenuifilum thalassicum]